MIGPISGMLRPGMRRTFGPTAGFGMLLAALAAGCGGGGASPPAPTLPHALGTRLADQTQLAEASLARGASCRAAAPAAQLRDAVAAAVTSGQVPATLRAPLSDSVASLAGEIRCVAPPPPAHRPRHHKPGDEGKGHGHGHGHGNGQGDGGDEGQD